ncbi:putative replication protein [Zea mays]|uniref:Putative replication protein n=1 Tax=Zea mays TaxID=4577 RepID=A0A1D6LBP4_MAIZE|nr:putative replication protein [Zea mays]
MVDVLGVVSVISQVSSVRTRGRQAEVMKRTVTISNARDTGPTVDVVLWGERATAFPAEQVHRDSGSSPQIIIFVGTLVRSYADNVSLSGGSSCKWYINEPVPEVNALRASAETNHHPVIWDQGKAAAESTVIAVPEHKKLKDIKYLHPFENKKKEWLVIVKVLKIDSSWWYNACKKCLRTTKPHGDTYKCTNISFYMPLQYPLLFTFGERGFQFGVPYVEMEVLGVVRTSFQRNYADPNEVTAVILGGAGEDDRGRKSQQEGHKEHQQHKLTLPTVSNYTIHDATDGTDNGKQEDTEFNLTPDVDQRNGRDRSHQAG